MAVIPSSSSYPSSPVDTPGEVPATAEILRRVDRAAWFSSVGCGRDQRACAELLTEYLERCQVPRAPVRWAADWEEARRIARNLDYAGAVWRQEQARRSRALARVETEGREARLRDALNRLSIIGYEKVRPAIEDEELARVAAGAGLWTASLALVWAAVADVLAPEQNPFLPKLQVFQMGYWPLGFDKGSFVIL